MKITRITKNTDRIKRKVLLDTDRLKEREKKVFERLANFNDLIDKKIDQITHRLINLIG